MLNPNNLQQVANNLEDILQTVVSVSLLEKLSEAERNRIVWLIGQWTRPSVAVEQDVLGEIKKMLDRAKTRIAPKKRYSTGQYLKINDK